MSASLDPITFEVIKNALSSVAEPPSTGLLIARPGGYDEDITFEPRAGSAWWPQDDLVGMRGAEMEIFRDLFLRQTPPIISRSSKRLM